MTDSLRAFMKGLIDYAGLFPPAKLPLETALRNYADYRKSNDAWMLSRFIIPWSMLDELTPYRDELLDEDDPFEFSILGSKTDTVPDFLESVDRITDACNQFHEEQGRRVTTEILETRIPAEAALSRNTELLGEMMERAAEKLAESPATPDWIFYETLFEESWKSDVEAAIEAIASFNDQSSGKRAGYKLRCGGVKADMFPSLEQVAHALNRARENGIAVKCTAGLHHPVRLFHESVQTKMHGFFNVFGGALMAHNHGLDDGEFQQILREEDPDAFSFTDKEFRWNGYAVSTGKIRQLREEHLISFGSCSFDEPREDLQQLKLL